MTILNIHINEEDKEKLQDLVEINKIKSMSEAVRQMVAEKIKIDEVSRDMENEIHIPKYIPKNKYVGFVKGAIIGIGDTVSEVSDLAAEKFPNGPLVIKYNGTKKKPMEYIFMSLKELNCWKFAEVDNIRYPIIPVKFISNSVRKPLYALIDTAASLCLVKKDIIDPTKLTISREESISTAAGEISSKIYKADIELIGIKFGIEFIISPINNSLPFNMLIGRNLLNKLDAYFFGKKEVVCLRLAED
ncbi:MAG: ribbon-helix-helix protein, CopG family [Promethearchaeota archaeon]|nr:MAG: ribbon-helix-helix protein, CopG family [Candidatus Lokiarchaeota archaeon]